MEHRHLGLIRLVQQFFLLIQIRKDLCARPLRVLELLVHLPNPFQRHVRIKHRIEECHENSGCHQVQFDLIACVKEQKRHHDRAQQIH